MEKMKISVFTFQLHFFLLFFQFYPSFTLTFHPQISLFWHQTCPWPFSFPLKPSASSPLQNHHHLRRSTLDFWRKNSYVVKVTSFLFFFFFSVRLHPFFVCFFIFVFSFYHFIFNIKILLMLALLFACLWVLCFCDGCLDYSFWGFHVKT